ncbi:MAG: sulfite exporter TauE/SafE family protein [Candidatus Caldarchaeum sp.]|nr:sulfite exporter TauE/SafE family protein [Candidatus Caldarchaeum sp.]
MELLSAAVLTVLAFLSSVVGAIIGAGGGFVYTPLLTLMGYSPKEAVSTSLVMVFFNSVSASYVYHRQGRMKIRDSIWLGLATLPGAVLGYAVLASVNINLFRLLFGLFMTAVSSYLLVRLVKNNQAKERQNAEVNVRKTILLSPLIGMLAGSFGIGGGILMAPALIHMAVPTHTATAVSQFITIFSSSSALLIISANSPPPLVSAVLVAVAGLVGGQVGAVISRSLRAKIIRAVIVSALMVVGVNMLLRSGFL